MTAAQASGHPIFRASLRGGVLCAALLALAGCSNGHLAFKNPIHIKHHRENRHKPDLPPSDVTTIGVNSFLWRASLDVLSFMPLVKADSNGGVIVTDWYVNPANPAERMKITVTILDKDLRSDALRVAASRQVQQAGGWVEAPVQAATVQKLEDVILTKARDLRRDTIIQ
ncbi:MAG TPA: DUF3576 domain-containing protein [Novosphingobium sp.]|nr:DUF3576 domain-containing protein [Novosphingobium sp.]HZV09717.1 DUF3576 domain-containing protein [Novosphingobium sp.]